MSVKHGEGFLQDNEAIEKRYQSHWDIAMMAVHAMMTACSLVRNYKDNHKKICLFFLGL